MTKGNILERFSLLVGTTFGLGYIPFASGTFGAMPGALLSYAVALAGAHAHLPPVQLLVWQSVFALTLTLLAVPICDTSERLLGRKDDGRIVADETLTFPICTIGLPLLAHPGMLAVAFVVNRACDIVKPPPARRSQRLPGGWGIVVDDFLACLYALAINHAVCWLTI